LVSVASTLIKAATHSSARFSSCATSADRIKQAFDDLKIGKKYPDSKEERKRKSRVYAYESEEEKRKRNLILSADIAQELKRAEEWVAALNRVDATDTRLFGSKEHFQSKASIGQEV